MEAGLPSVGGAYKAENWDARAKSKMQEPDLFTQVFKG